MSIAANKLFSRYEQRGSALLEMALIVALVAVLFLIAITVMFHYQRNSNFFWAVQRDKSNLNSVMQAAARYGHFCPARRAVTISALLQLNYLGTMPDFKNINSGTIYIEVKPNEPVAGLSTSPDSALVILNGDLTALKPEEIDYYRRALPAHFVNRDHFTIARRYAYSTYQGANDAGLGAAFSMYTDTAPGDIPRCL